MARPVKYDRQEVLTTAMNAFWKNGFERSSVKSLSESLGMTRSSFYNAFGSREALFREAIPQYVAQAPASILDREAGAPALYLLTRLVQEVCRTDATDPEGRGCMLQNTVNELCPDDDGLGADLARIVLASVERIEGLLHTARSDGDLPDTADPHALALAIQNLMMGLNVLCKVVRDEAELWLLAKTTLRGLGVYYPVAE